MLALASAFLRAHPPLARGLIRLVVGAVAGAGSRPTEITGGAGDAGRVAGCAARPLVVARVGCRVV